MVGMGKVPTQGEPRSITEYPGWAGLTKLLQAVHAPRYGLLGLERHRWFPVTFQPHQAIAVALGIQ